MPFRVEREPVEDRFALHDETIRRVLTKVARRVNPDAAELLTRLIDWLPGDRRRMLAELFDPPPRIWEDRPKPEGRVITPMRPERDWLSQADRSG